MKESNKNTYTTAFHRYKKLGLDPLPIRHINGHPSKKPTDTCWQRKAANGEYTEADFADPCNAGILLGGPKNVTDIDCDSPEEAIVVAGDIMKHFMEETGETMMFGRSSKPRSHYIFFCDQSLPSEEIRDPSDGKCIIEYRCVNGDGSRGHQTVFPPSQNHNPKTGVIEQVQFDHDPPNPIAQVSARELHKRFVVIGAVSLLAKHFPIESERHNTILALAGLFGRSGMKLNKAAMIIGLSYRCSKGYNGDRAKAVSDVKSVYKTLDRSSESHLYGYTKLTEIMPKVVIDKVLELLGIERPETTHTLNDAGNGRRLVEKHKDDIRYCVDDKEWYVWDGVRWQKDVIQKIREYAKGIANDIRNEADRMNQQIPTGDHHADKEAVLQCEIRKRELLKWANQSENADRVSKTLKSAESDPWITCFRSDFDKDSNLLNCPNAIVDLYTGANDTS